MSDLKFLRDKYGLNQDQIGEWLGISRTHVAHYERHVRSLPQDASSKHTQMLILLAEMETTAAKAGDSRKPDLDPDPATEARIDHVKIEIAYQENAAAHKAVRMKKKYVAIQKQYTQTRDWIELLEMLMKVVTEEKSEKDFLWLQDQHYEAGRRLLKCDEAVQLEMRWKISRLEALAGVEL